MNLFMMPPVMAMHGMMEVRARARRQLRMYARMKPVKKAPRKLTTKATFSDVPICTKSADMMSYVRQDGTQTSSKTYAYPSEFE